jgi:guanylate kinase
MPGGGHVFVITGPSGVGKGTLIGALLKRVPQLRLAVSATTRPPRAGERDGFEYYFLSPEEFAARVAAGEFAEHLPRATQIFIAPPSFDELRSRLQHRGTDDADKIERRLQVAESEIEAQSEFAHVVVNDDLQRALGELQQIVTAALGSDVTAEVQ